MRAIRNAVAAGCLLLAGCQTPEQLAATEAARQAEEAAMQAEAQRRAEALTAACAQSGFPLGSAENIACAVDLANRLRSPRRAEPDPVLGAYMAMLQGMNIGQAFAPPPSPQARNCTSQVFGNTVHTNCW
jgi:hypothetical protein